MRRAAWVTAGAAIALAGCGHRESGSDGNAVLKAPVADPAEIANFVPPAAPASTPTPRAGAQASTDPGDRENGSPAAAQEVATRYYAYIAARRYADAWGLWSGHGKASMLSPADFAAQFQPYHRYVATIGVLRNPSGGADQQFIIVPVRIDAIDANGRPAPQAGTLTLHRIPSAIDTGDPSAHLWRISVAAIKPA